MTQHTCCSSPTDTRIVRASIHPAIGVARVGNSPGEYFIGPQVIEPAPMPIGFYRDKHGAIKRQAAEFRIYGYNQAGKLVKEITAECADIRWSVHVANHKAAWYQWEIALDIPEAATTEVPLRNPNVQGPEARKGLAIDGGLRSISGKNACGEAYQCSGAFMGVPVNLGELRTDDRGRLLFLGGHGVSDSPDGSPIFDSSDPNGFINANGWYDDTSDGPVMAEVCINGEEIPVEPAWVITAPPDYAPQVKAIRTLYDLLYDLYVRQDWLAGPVQISFSRDVYPILKRLTGLQWVNQGFAVQFGHGGNNDFEDANFIDKLASKPTLGEYDLYAELRLQVLNSFRNPSNADGNPLPWPWIYGDAVEIKGSASPRQNSAITSTQYKMLQRWAHGDFADDWGKLPPLPTSIDEVPLNDQPATLDRAALEFCLADAFHPGCETTWPMRHLTVYRQPFRIRQRPANQPEPDYGETLDQKKALSLSGPLHNQGPGDITRWMGLPWQGDTAYCRSGYNADYDPFLPTFWPARVPNQVLTEKDYAVVVNPDEPREKRLQAYAQRTSWNKPLHGSVAQQMEQMVRIFGSMGLLELRQGVYGDPAFPETMLVATFGPDSASLDQAESGAQEASATAKPSGVRSPRSANFASSAEASLAPVPVRHRPKSL